LFWKIPRRGSGQVARRLAVAAILLVAIAGESHAEPAADVRDARVTLHVRNGSAFDVVRLFAASSKDLSFVIAFEPGGNLTGDFKDASWNSVLDWALRPAGFEAREQGGVVLVTPSTIPALATLVDEAPSIVQENRRFVAEGVPARELFPILARNAGYRDVLLPPGLDASFFINVRSRTTTWEHVLSAALNALCLTSRDVEGVLQISSACAVSLEDSSSTRRSIRPHVRRSDSTELETQRNSVDEFRLVATFGLTGDFPRAILENPSGERYLAQVGTIVGRKWGTVSEIGETTLIVREEERGNGKRAPKLSTLTLAPVPSNK
jgi:hypothetical protein